MWVPRPSKDVKFQPPGLFLVVKGLKFQTLGGFRYTFLIRSGIYSITCVYHWYFGHVPIFIARLIMCWVFSGRLFRKQLVFSTPPVWYPHLTNQEEPVHLGPGGQGAWIHLDSQPRLQCPQDPCMVYLPTFTIKFNQM